VFEITEKASDMIKDFLKDREESPSVRLTLIEGGCSGPSVGLALDESKENDTSFEDRGITFVVDKDFFEHIKPVTIDYVTTPMGEGFNISSSLPKPEGACGSCAGSCS
jgi:iron-sulfur cluster assembly protein